MTEATQLKCHVADCSNKVAFQFTWPWGKVDGVCGEHTYTVGQTCSNMGINPAPQLIPVTPDDPIVRAHELLAKLETTHAQLVASAQAFDDCVHELQDFINSKTATETEPATVPDNTKVGSVPDVPSASLPSPATATQTP